MPISSLKLELLELNFFQVGAKTWSIPAIVMGRHRCYAGFIDGEESGNWRHDESSKGNRSWHKAGSQEVKTIKFGSKAITK